jgi:hypothetical protein
MPEIGGEVHRRHTPLPDLTLDDVPISERGVQAVEDVGHEHLGKG